MKKRAVTGFSTQTDADRAAEIAPSPTPITKWIPQFRKFWSRMPGQKEGFHRVFAAPDDPTTIDEAAALSLVILVPPLRMRESVAKTSATDADDGRTDALRAIPAPLS